MTATTASDQSSHSTATNAAYETAAALSASPHEWTVKEVLALFELPLPDLMFRAQEAHRRHFNPNEVQRSSLLSIKTGGCSEDCGYCSQSARNDAKLEREKLMPLDEVLEHARAAKEKGASRFCMGAAWRSPKERDLTAVIEMVKGVKALGLETCVTLGMLEAEQARRLKEAGLDYYNHNIDTSAEFYGQIVTTHSQQERFDTIDKVRDAGINVCSGGIIGMGESRRNRATMIVQLANMTPPPESVPINNLVPIPGTALENAPPLDPFEFVRTIAAARITMPSSFVRLSAGREQMSDELPALCFMAGANSMFYGEKLLTTGNADADRDEALLERLGMTAV